MTATFPAPWSLRGCGHIFVYRFSRAFLAQEAVVPSSLRSAFVGGFGALMMVDYSQSNCGPYRELLLIPGNFRIRGKTHASISRIFVSTDVSVTNGRRNWGIPKERADFSVAQTKEGGAHWLVRSGASVLFSARVRPTWFPMPIPLHTAFIPHTLAQCWNDEVFVTRVSAHGWGKAASLEVEPTEHEVFPGLARERPLFSLGMRAKPFNMTFHQARLATASVR